MSKANKIIYWVATIWLSLGMVSTSLVQILKRKEDVAFILQLGYPEYFLTIIGVWKLLGVVAILLPRFWLVKEWAYAGFFFMMSGAIFSHIAMHNGIAEIAPALLLLALTVVSWYFRPASRKLVLAHK
jgi:hypothetical protein